MKNSGRCPKCGSFDVIKIKGMQQAYGVGDNIVSGTFSQAYVSKYLCCNCGYIEEWLENLSDIEKIKKHQAKKQKNKLL